MVPIGGGGANGREPTIIIFDEYDSSGTAFNQRHQNVRSDGFGGLGARLIRLAAAMTVSAEIHNITNVALGELNNILVGKYPLDEPKEIVPYHQQPKSAKNGKRKRNPNRWR